MPFPDHPGFTIISDLSRVRKPQGAPKKSQRLRARRQPIYIPTTTEAKEEAARWLRHR